jgi:LacI family transcriptional regulator
MSSDNQQRRTGRPTIRDVARTAGVSIATVSRVMNGRPDVAAATRERVQGAVRELGFSTNRSARSLVGGRTFLVGIMLPLVEAEYFSRIVAGAADELYDHDLQVVLAPTLHLRDRSATLLARLAGGMTDGALLILPEESSEALRRLARTGYPFVVIDPLEPLDEDVPSVSATNALGGRAATEHLLALGHRRIGAITGIPEWLASVERLNGYRAALASAGVVPDSALVVESDWAVEGGEAAAALLLDLPDPPTAVFAFNDNMAIGALRAARARGLRVPADFSVVGFDDSEQATTATPGLTTVRQPVAAMGRIAVSLLLRLLEHRRGEELSIELQTRLIVRDSTAAPGASSNRERELAVG